VPHGLLSAGLAVGLFAALAGCGHGTDPRRPPVRLTIDSPADGARLSTGSVDVTGTVSPRDAVVRVRGVRTSSGGGTFNARVRLVPGANVIDVLAGAARARPAMSAVRVYRQVMVAVPDVAGERPSDASASLTSRGLTPQVVSSGGPFEFLVPAERRVCKTDPPAGKRVAPGTKVRLLTAKLC
jgi:Glucodextranase, domain B/PASTA domain